MVTNGRDGTGRRDSYSSDRQTDIPFPPIDIPTGNGCSIQSLFDDDDDDDPVLLLLSLLSLLLPFFKLALVLVLVLDLPLVEILVGVNGSGAIIAAAAVVDATTLVVGYRLY